MMLYCSQTTTVAFIETLRSANEYPPSSYAKSKIRSTLQSSAPTMPDMFTSMSGK